MDLSKFEFEPEDSVHCVYLDWDMGIEVSDEKLKNKSPEEIEKYLEEVAKGWAEQNISAGYTILEEE
jgi:hypothetical protein